jgi:hypothetical protein
MEQEVTHRTDDQTMQCPECYEIRTLREWIEANGHAQSPATPLPTDGFCARSAYYDYQVLSGARLDCPECGHVSDAIDVEMVCEGGPPEVQARERRGEVPTRWETKQWSLAVELCGLEFVGWECRTFHEDTTATPGWSGWERVVPRNPCTDVVDRVREIEAYIEQGYKYQLRALYSKPHGD